MQSFAFSYYYYSAQKLEFLLNTLNYLNDVIVLLRYKVFAK